MLPTHRLDYPLPERLIATHPASPRDASRLMVVSRADPHRREHRTFRDLPEYLGPADVLIRNTSAVLPARLAATRVDTGGRVSGLFLDEPEPARWTAMIKSNGRLRPGAVLELHHPDDPSRKGPTLTLEDRQGPAWTLRVDSADAAPTILARVGATPLPPYILSARKQTDDHTPDQRDRGDYQTIYADARASRSVAAPTAGLHFTPELDSTIAAAGVRTHAVVLHVGAGTFAPVTARHVEEHPIHTELITVPRRTTLAIDDARAAGGRSVVVGTTTCRALESVPEDETSYEGPTDILITPGYAFRRTDALVTNFHLPRSTLLAMVSALFDAPDPVHALLAHYRAAIDEGYRFYSFGDAMLILP